MELDFCDLKLIGQCDLLLKSTDNNICLNQSIVASYKYYCFIGIFLVWKCKILDVIGYLISNILNLR